MPKLTVKLALELPDEEPANLPERITVNEEQSARFLAWLQDIMESQDASGFRPRAAGGRRQAALESWLVVNRVAYAVQLEQLEDCISLVEQMQESIRAAIDWRDPGRGMICDAVYEQLLRANGAAVQAQRK